MTISNPTSRCAASTILLLAAAGCCMPSWAGPKNVLFRASVATQETLRPDPAVCVGAPYLVGTTTGTGTALHMGKITFIANDCVVPGPTSFTFSNGKLVITAANGDELEAGYDGMLLPIPHATPFTLYTISGRFTVSGGTGRFTGATGSGYLQGTANVRTGQGHYEAIGTISY